MTNFEMQLTQKQAQEYKWELSDEICGERLYPMVEEYLKQLAKNGELEIYPQKVMQEGATRPEA